MHIGFHQRSADPAVSCRPPIRFFCRYTCVAPEFKSQQRLIFSLPLFDSEADPFSVFFGISLLSTRTLLFSSLVLVFFPDPFFDIHILAGAKPQVDAPFPRADRSISAFFRCPNVFLLFFRVSSTLIDDRPRAGAVVYSPQTLFPCIVTSLLIFRPPPPGLSVHESLNAASPFLS